MAAEIHHSLGEFNKAGHSGFITRPARPALGIAEERFLHVRSGRAPFTFSGPNNRLDVRRGVGDRLATLLTCPAVGLGCRPTDCSDLDVDNLVDVPSTSECCCEHSETAPPATRLNQGNTVGCI